MAGFIPIIFAMYYTYQEIEQFTLDECKIAKLQLQMKLPDIKAKLNEWRDGLHADLDGERLEKKYRHLRRLLHKVEMRMIVVKKEMGIDKKDLSDHYERNRKANEHLGGIVKPKPFHAIFCQVAHQYLDERTIEELTRITQQNLIQLKSEFDF